MTIVNVIDNDTHEIVAANVTLDSCFPDDPESAQRAKGDLDAYGRAIVGGGASPIMRLVRAES